MSDALTFVYGVITSSWTWLRSWQFQGVSFGHYLVGFIILSILIERIFN